MNVCKCAACPECGAEKESPVCLRYGKPCRQVKACGFAGRKRFNRPFSRKSGEAARRFYEENKERGE